MSFHEFFQELAKRGVKWQKTGSFFELELATTNGIRWVPVEVKDLEARVLPSLLRSTCARLGIDPAEFGFVLG
jgi:hypothetical protein